MWSCYQLLISPVDILNLLGDSRFRTWIHGANWYTDTSFVKFRNKLSIATLSLYILPSLHYVSEFPAILWIVVSEAINYLLEVAIAYMFKVHQKLKNM